MIKKVVVSKENIKEVFDKISPIFKGDFATTHFWQPVKSGFVQGCKKNMFVNRDLISPKRLLDRKARTGRDHKYPYPVDFDYDNIVSLKDTDGSPYIFVGSRDEDSYINIQVGDIFYFHSSGKFVYIDVDNLSTNHIGLIQLLVVPMHFSESLKEKIYKCNEVTKRANDDFYEAQMRRDAEDEDEEPECFSPDDENSSVCIGDPEAIDQCQECIYYKG